MLTPEDIKNLIILVNRATYGNLNEAKAGVVLEQKLRAMLQPPKELEEQVGTQESATDGAQ